MLTRLRPPRAFPTGSLTIGVGCLASGAGAYGFLIVTARVLGPARFTPLSQLWTVALMLGPGIFLTVEQEITRRVSQLATQDSDWRAAVLRRSQAGAVLAIVSMVIALGMSPLIVHRVFAGNAMLFVGLELAFPAYLAQHVTLGRLAGSRRFTRYALVVGSEGITRVVGATALAMGGVRSPGVYGLFVGGAPFIGVLAFGGWRAARQLRTVDRNEGLSAAGAAIGALLAGSLANQVLLMVPPLAVVLLARPGETEEAATLVVAMVLVRVPLFLFNAVLATLLSQLSDSVGAGSRDLFHRALGRLLVLVAGCTGVSIVLGAVAGPWLVSRVFGPEYRLRGVDVAILAGACGAYLAAVVLGQALIAMRAHLLVSAAWLIGLAGFAAALAFERPVLDRVELAFLVGCTISALAMGAQVFCVVWGRPPDAELIRNGRLEEKRSVCANTSITA